jgi:hypothetical protein
VRQPSKGQGIAGNLLLILAGVPPEAGKMADIYAEFKGCSPLLTHITSGRLNLCIELFSEVCFWPFSAYDDWLRTTQDV